MLTVRSRVIGFVDRLAKTPNAFDELERLVFEFRREELQEALLECGVIPELFDHDSSQEKLWAKYCDGKASEYWAAVDTVTASLCGADLSELEEMKHLELEKLKELGQEGITYWEQKIVEYQGLTQKEAVAKLIKAEKIEAKINTIKRAISWTAV